MSRNFALVVLCLTVLIYPAQDITHTLGNRFQEVSVVSVQGNGPFSLTLTTPLPVGTLRLHDLFRDASGHSFSVTGQDAGTGSLIVADQEKLGVSPATGRGIIGSWFTSLTSWQLAQKRNLTAVTRYSSGENEILLCFDDFPSGITVPASFKITGWQTGSQNRLIIRVAEGHRHNGKRDQGFRLRPFLTQTWQETPATLNVEQSYVELDGLSIQGYRTGYHHGIRLLASNCIVTGCLISDILWNSITIQAGGARVFNSVILRNLDAGIRGIQITGTFSTSVYFDNNTLLADVYSENQKVVYRNNIMGGTYFTGPYDTTFSDYNLGRVTNLPGTHSTNVSSLSGIGFIDSASGSEDVHLSETSPGVDHSTNLSTDYPAAVDADGYPRGTVWDMGAYERGEDVLALPDIRNIGVSQVGKTSAVVTWTTALPVFSTLRYGSGPSSLTTVLSSNSASFSHTVVLSGLAENSAVYFQVECSDHLHGTSQSAITAFHTLASSPPPAITDLSARADEPSQTIMLSWTAPGTMADCGQTSAYLIRYRQSPFSEAEFTDAGDIRILCKQAPTPAFLGVRESLLVGPLDAGLPYYFAVKSITETGDTSAMSVLATVSLPPASGDVWPTFHHDPYNTRLSNDSLVPPFTLKWSKRQMAAEVLTRHSDIPLVYAQYGKIFSMTRKYGYPSTMSVHAYDPGNGDSLWMNSFTEHYSYVFSGVGLSRTFTSSFHHCGYAAFANNGEKTSYGVGNTGFLNFFNGRAYFCGGTAVDGSTCSLFPANPINGSSDWSVSWRILTWTGALYIIGQGASNPVTFLPDGTVLRTIEAGDITAYNGTTGAQQWSIGCPVELETSSTYNPPIQSGPFFVRSPIYRDGKLYAAGVEKAGDHWGAYFYTYDAVSRQCLQRFALPWQGEGIDTLAIRYQRFLFLPIQDYAIKGNVVVVSGYNIPIRGSKTIGAAIDSGLIGPEICGYDLTDTTLLWSTHHSQKSTFRISQGGYASSSLWGNFNTRLALSGDYVYYSVGDSVTGTPSNATLYCADIRTGDTVWTYHGDPGTRYFGPPIIAYQTLYVADDEGKVYAFEPQAVAVEKRELSNHFPVELSCSPSPFSSGFLLNFRAAGPARFEIYDIRGKVVQRFETEGLKNFSQKRWVDMRQSAAGLYFIRMKTQKAERVVRSFLIR
ncbi:MAG: PQQ-binding-like beta-propeller repeat protein [Fibrobacterota bacterium]